MYRSSYERAHASLILKQSYTHEESSRQNGHLPSLLFQLRGTTRAAHSAALTQSSLAAGDDTQHRSSCYRTLQCVRCMSLAAAHGTRCLLHAQQTSPLHVSWNAGCHSRDHTLLHTIRYSCVADIAADSRVARWRLFVSLTLKECDVTCTWVKKIVDHHLVTLAGRRRHCLSHTASSLRAPHLAMLHSARPAGYHSCGRLLQYTLQYSAPLLTTASATSQRCHLPYIAADHRSPWTVAVVDFDTRSLRTVVVLLHHVGKVKRHCRMPTHMLHLYTTTRWLRFFLACCDSTFF